ncbi:DUF4376 domain-containing protein [Acinetobacter baumannii]|uniref:DUF4376 domain-containing protein n=1 Tax=Acinetobacter baumannii TaxID=470 RepID=UPI0022B52EA2|nr:DUF4376 domain-containing protein [Acinetobacter baumannii]
MDTFLYIDQSGKILGKCAGEIEYAEINKPTGSTLIKVGPNQESISKNTHFYDFVEKCFIPLPPKTTLHSEFNYFKKKWVDTISLEMHQDRKWNEIKLKRDEFEFSGFEYDGHIYESDAISQMRIVTAAMVGVPVVWTLKDNTFESLSTKQLNELRIALANHIESIHERGRIARDKIYKATSIEELDLIDL